MSIESPLRRHSWLPAVLVMAAIVVPPGWNLVQYWLYNPMYGYGLWVPFLAVLLAWRNTSDGPPTPQPPVDRESLRWPAKLVPIAYFLSLPLLRIVQIANPDWRMLDWLLVGGAVAALLALTWLIGGVPLLRRWWLPIVFLLTAVPWSTAGERFFTTHAMPLTATGSSELLWLFHLPVVDEGSVLHTALGPVRVTEDCSGIRGVQLALMAGVFWAGWLQLRAWRGILLVVSGIALALLTNLLRVSSVAAFTLRSGSIATADHLHDSAGGISQVALMVGIPLIGLGLRPRPGPAREASGLSAAWQRIPISAAIAAVLWVAATEAGAEAWFRMHEAGQPDRVAYWSVPRPIAVPKASEQPVAPAIRESLRYSDALSVDWTDAAGLRWELFWLDFAGGALSACTHNFHRPDLCLPSNDYTLVRNLSDLSVEIQGNPVVLHHSVYQRDGRPLHLFHTTISQNNAAGDPSDLTGWTWAGRFQAAWEGRRSHRSQMIHLLLYGDKPVAEARVAAVAYLGQLLRPDMR